MYRDDEDVAATSRFSERDVTSGLPDDSREADEQTAERRLRELRGRVKAARAAIATTPELAEILARDWLNAARFYARYGITEAQFRHGAPGPESDLKAASSRDLPGIHVERSAESRSWGGATR